LSKLQIRTADVFAPLLQPARYKGAFGSRGSGKSHFFAELGLEDALRWPGEHGGEGIRFLSAREIQKSLKESAKRLFEDKLARFGLGEAQGFKVFREVISTPGDGVILFQGLQDHTADSIKSLEGIDRAWVEEAQSLSDRSLTLLRPTIRKEGSELWFSWNPQRPTDPIDRLLRSSAKPTGAVVVKANWSDNPWLPSVLDQERRDMLANEPEKYPHVWEGEYARVLEGAYFAKHLTECELSGRIGFYQRDPLLKVYSFWDIAGTGDKADATAIWVCQFISGEIRVLDYYEAVGQPFDAHVYWLRTNGWSDAVCVLPHDGAKHDVVYAATPSGYLSKAGFQTETVKNQGRGAALQRIDAVRAIFQNVRFNRETTEAGREALGWYHEKRDEARNVGLGPSHDWASHGADAFGLMAVWYQRNQGDTGRTGPIRRRVKGIV
jgi:phage terminase large subunit